MQHLDDRQHSSTRYQNVQSIDQRIEFVRLVRIHELFGLTNSEIWGIEGSFLHLRGPWQWAQAPPYADAGGGVFGEDPYVSTVEFYVTPFDRLVVIDDPLDDRSEVEESVVSVLQVGDVIGLRLFLPDFDNSCTNEQAWYTFPELRSYELGDIWEPEFFGDAVLVGADGSGVPDSAVENVSWGRIKVSLHTRNDPRYAGTD